MKDKYPSEAGWFYNPGRGNGYTNCVGPSPFGDDCGNSLADASEGFNLTNHIGNSEVVEICERMGQYSSVEYSDPEESIIFCKESYDRWVELYG